MSASTPPGLRLALVLVMAAVVQAGLLTHLRIADVAPDLLLVVAIAGGLVAGETRGAIGGFCAGLAVDLLTWGRPFGLAVLIFTLVGWACGRFRTATAYEGGPPNLVVAAVAGVLAVTGYLAGAYLLGAGDVFGGRYAVVAGLVAVWSALLVLPVSALMRWVWGDEEDATAWAR